MGDNFKDKILNCDFIIFIIGVDPFAYFGICPKSL
jgi:hypothetical protein